MSTFVPESFQKKVKRDQLAADEILKQRKEKRGDVCEQPIINELTFKTIADLNYSLEIDLHKAAIRLKFVCSCKSETLASLLTKIVKCCHLQNLKTTELGQVSRIKMIEIYTMRKTEGENARDLWRRRRDCCACCSRANIRRLVAARRSVPMSASSPRPTRT